jgi:photosystem II stability/assembly factor-like uncharacterized protein
MKALLTVSLIILSFVEIYAQQTGWFWQNPFPQGNDYNNIRFINSSTAFAVTSGGTLEKTTDGGITWQHFLTLDNRSANDCFFFNNLTGYIAGDNIKFLKTTDGGLSFVNFNIPGNQTQLLSSVQFINENTGFVASGLYFGYPFGIFKTTDACQSWVFTISDSISIESIFFTDVLNGYFVGGDLGNGYIRKTTNGGITWFTQLTIPGSGINVPKNVKFFDINTGYALKGNLYKTINSGNNWLQVPVPSQFNNNINSFEFLNSNTGFIVNNPYVYPAYCYIAKTTNGGVSWDTSKVYSNSTLKIVSFSDINSGFLLGKYGGIFKTTNSGLNWTDLYSGFINIIFGIQFINYNTGFVCGLNIFAKTNNGGENWIKYQVTATPTIFGGLYFVNDQTGFIAGEGRKVFKTTDGGNNWLQTIVPGTSDNLTCVKFTGPNTGYLSSINGRIYKTTDAGEVWSIIYTVATHPVLNDMYFINSNTGFACGGSAGAPILKTTDGGTSWSIFTTNISGLGGIYMADDNTGFAVGSAGSIYKTTNSGANWFTVNSGTTINLNKVMFPSLNTGYIAGNQGLILKTTDAGNTWFRLPVLTKQYLYSLHFNDNNTGYIAGNGGNIFKTTTGGSVIGIIPVSNEIPGNYSLLQNYPNPFNPLTRLRFDIPQSKFVKIIVYDILGRELTTLVNEDLRAGTYEVTWDASDYPSGIYFYRLWVSGGSTDSKKMVLIK